MKLRLREYPLIATAVLLLTSFSAAAQNPDSARVTNLLRQAQEHAAQVDLYADQLATYTHSRLSWQSHALQLTRMKDEVNELGKDVADLTEAAPEASPWQQDAIEKIDPLLRSMADHLSATIKHLNEHQNQVHMPPYKDYAQANYEYSQKMLAMINDYVDYAEAKAQAEALEQKLLLSSEPSPGEE
jgi:hypothetical protein